jgi:cation-transporting P-type ATPase E
MTAQPQPPTASTTSPGPADLGLTYAEVEVRVSRGDVSIVPTTTSRTVASILVSNILTRFNLLLG